MNANNLNTKVDSITSNDEVGSLAQSFNTMTDRLERSFEAQKSFASNAAHELKTPLTTMKASLQILNLGDTPTIDEYKKNNAVMEQTLYIVQIALLIVTDGDFQHGELTPFSLFPGSVGFFILAGVAQERPERVSPGRHPAEQHCTTRRSETPHVLEASGFQRYL